MVFVPAMEQVNSQRDAPPVAFRPRPAAEATASRNIHRFVPVKPERARGLQRLVFDWVKRQRP
jgi:hypothetical protein